MKILILAFLLFVSISFAQSNEKYLLKFLNESDLKPENQLDNYFQFDFSNVWTQSSNNIIYGIIGTEHQRIHIKLLSVKKSKTNHYEYFVTGKSWIKETICDFNGTILFTEIREVKELHFGVDDEFKGKGIKKQGILIAEYKFEENTQQQHNGVFKGKLYTKWYLSKRNKIVYDNIQSHSDGYSNNAFIGSWKSNSTNKEKICNWADWRVPNANQDFDIGVGEFNVSEKYISNGWLDVTLNNQVPNLAIKRTKRKKNKEWWE